MITEYEINVDVNGSPCRFESIIRHHGPVFAARIDVNQQGWMFQHYFDTRYREDNYSDEAAANLLLPNGFTVDTVNYVEGEYGEFLAITGHLSAWTALGVGEWAMQES